MLPRPRPTRMPTKTWAWHPTAVSRPSGPAGDQDRTASRPRPEHGAFQRQGQRLGALAADEEAGAVGEVKADAAVAPGVEDALAVAARADAPAPVVGQRAIGHHLDSDDRADQDDPAIGRDPA